VTGWCIGESRRSAAGNAPTDNAAEAESLYAKLEGVILTMYYNDRAKFLEVMQHAIAINGSFFNTQRMVQQYITTRICAEAARSAAKHGLERRTRRGSSERISAAGFCTWPCRRRHPFHLF